MTDLIHTHKKVTREDIKHAFRAVTGALYVDKGPLSARKIVHDFVIPQLAGRDLHELIKLQHPKFMLRAILKGQRQLPPVTRLIKESGRLTHFPSFVVGVYSGGKLLAEGCGTSLKRAEKEAVIAALHKHFQTELANTPLPSDRDDEFKIQFMSQNEGKENT